MPISWRCTDWQRLILIDRASNLYADFYESFTKIYNFRCVISWNQTDWLKR
jgi:hypothetical protein